LNAIGVTNIDPYKSARTGETSRLGQGTIPKGSDLIAAQISNKLAPFPGLIYDFYSGRTDADGNRVNQIGEPYTFQREVIDRTVPMFLTTMIDVAKSEPDLVQAFIASTALVGYGVNTLKKPEKTATQQIREKSAKEGDVSTGELKAQLQTSRIKALPRKDAKSLYENLTNDAVSSRYKWGEREAFRVLKTLFKNEKGLKLDNGKLIETTFTDAEKEAIKQAYIQQLKERDEMVSLLNQLDVKNYYGSRIDWDAKNKKESDWSKFVR